MPASIPKAQGSSNEVYLVGTPRSRSSVSISNETAIGRGINSGLNWIKKTIDSAAQKGITPKMRTTDTLSKKKPKRKPKR
jgi:hypothetical protein